MLLSIVPSVEDDAVTGGVRMSPSLENVAFSKAPSTEALGLSRSGVDCRKSAADGA